ncbi:MAG: adenylyl-sulfate kinase [Thermodesulfobacteriota bacterium]
MNTEFIIPTAHALSRRDRASIKGHDGLLLFFTGLSGSGKTTIANEVEFRLNKQHGAHTYLLDGDHLRQGLSRDLTFSERDIRENWRRIGEVAKFFLDAGIILLTAVIAPYRRDRETIRQLAGSDSFVEIFVNCPLAICEERDPKGLYNKARAGIIPEFIGIDSPYEPPERPDIVLDSAGSSPDACAARVIAHIASRLAPP